MRAVGVVYRGASPLWPAGLVIASAAVVVVATTTQTITTLAIMAAAATLTTLSFVALARGALGHRRARQAITADARGLSVGTKLVLPLHAIARARVRDDSDGVHTVVVTGRRFRGPWFIRVESPRIAQALADALGAESQELARFDALPPWAHGMRWLAVALTTCPWIIFNILRHVPPAVVVGVLSLYGVIALPMILRQRVTVGHDGVFLEWAGRTRFLAYGAVRDVRPTPLGVLIELVTGGTLEIRLTQRSGAEGPRAHRLLARIRRAMAAHRRLPRAEDESLLAQGPREHDAWHREVSALGEDAGAYRKLSLPRERLWAVVESSAADLSAREGAAIALHAKLDDHERERLAAVARRTASPRLRLVIDAVARAPEITPDEREAPTVASEDATLGANR
jgi:hypothetical protein